MATPHPDPSDKRLPGILHSYFGQVGERPFTAPTSPVFPPLVHFPPDMEAPSTTSSPDIDASRVILPLTPSSLLRGYTAARQEPLLPASTEQGKSAVQETRLERVGVVSYPTPPASSSSSTRRTSEAGSEGSSRARHASSPGACDPSGKQHLGHAVMPLCTRRKTGGLNPLSNITTNSSVHAAHLSNPVSSRPTTRPSTPTSDSPARSALSSLTSHLDQVKLTDDVVSPRNKNTPPLTPRALSNDGSESAKHSQRPTDSPSGKSIPAHSSPHASPPVNPPKGKLSVVVSQARGLRPSYNPYAVTVFEWIESVARPSKAGPTETENDSKRAELLGGVPIKRSGSDMGRSMAIPMKSRQSSTTSLSDQKDFKNGRYITDPRWDHVAILYLHIKAPVHERSADFLS